MANRFDYTRLSDFVSGSVDRKIRAVSMSITSSYGQLKSFVSQASDKADAAFASAASANSYANNAAIASSAALQAYDSFVASFGGVLDHDPIVSTANQPFNSSAFYINSTTGRIRYATGVDTNGKIVWGELNSVTDKAVVAEAGKGVFAALNATTVQVFNAPVQFKQIVSVPKVTDWLSQQAVGAADVQAIATSLQSSIAGCVSLAAEQRIDTLDFRVAQTIPIKVPSWSSRAQVWIVGAGAGGNFTGTGNGSNSGGGGGSGAWAMGIMSVTPNATLNATIGAGGAGATMANTYGAAGGDTFIDNLVRVGGGQQGAAIVTPFNGSNYSSGTASGSLGGAIVKPHPQLFCFVGNTGDSGDFINGAGTGGQGADGPFGGGGQPGSFGTYPATGPGAGGGGAYPTKGGTVVTKAAGRGADGAILIRWLP